MHYVIFLFPLLMDLAVSCFFFVIPLQASKLGLSDSSAGWLMAAFNVAYILVNTRVGHHVNAANARRVIVGSALAIAATSLLLAAVGKAWVLVLCILLLGSSCPVFFVGFQVFMGEIGGLPPLRSAALYTCSWTMGMALGPLAEGTLTGAARWLLPAPVLLAVAAILLLLRWCEPLVRDMSVPSAEWPPAYGPLCIRLGWLGMYAGGFGVIGIRNLLPKVGVEAMMLTPHTIAILMFLTGLGQAAGGFMGQYIGRCYGRAITQLCIGVLAVSGLIVAGSGVSSIWLAGLGFGVFSLAAGVLFHQAVAFSISDSAHVSHNVAGNELAMGSAAMTGSITCGYASQYGGGAWLFLAPAILLGLVMAVQVGALSLRPQSLPSTRGDESASSDGPGCL